MKLVHLAPIVVAFMSAALACSTGEAAARGAPVEHSEAARAGANEICIAGAANPDPVARPCGPGLECIYPCGLEGCSWICVAALPAGAPPRPPIP